MTRSSRLCCAFCVGRRRSKRAASGGLRGHPHRSASADAVALHPVVDLQEIRDHLRPRHQLAKPWLAVILWLCKKLCSLFSVHKAVHRRLGIGEQLLKALRQQRLVYRGIGLGVRALLSIQQLRRKQILAGVPEQLFFGNTAQKSRRDTARSDIIRPWINR